MNPACTAGQLDFHGLGRRAVVGPFDEGTSRSDSGGLLLGEGAQRRHMLKRLVGGFVDHRDASQIEPSVELLIKQGVMGLAWGYEDRNDHDTRSAHTRGVTYSLGACIQAVQETSCCFRLGDSIVQIANQRVLVNSTIYGHLEQAIQAVNQWTSIDCYPLTNTLKSPRPLPKPGLEI